MNMKLDTNANDRGDKDEYVRAGSDVGDDDDGDDDDDEE